MTTFGCVGSPRLHRKVCASIVSEKAGGLIDILSGWLRNRSICLCANTKAEESLRFAEFDPIEAGTNCARATIPTSRMTMAMRTSTSVNPRWFLQALVLFRRSCGFCITLSCDTSQLTRCQFPADDAVHTCTAPEGSVMIAR